MTSNIAESMGPREVARSLIRAIQTGDSNAALYLYAEDVELAVQFAFPEPLMLRGKDTLRAAFAGGMTRGRMYDDIEMRDLWIGEASDGIVVAEWTYVSKINGVEVRNGNVILLKIEDGKIKWSRDYHNHVTRAVADGNLPEVIDQIRQIPVP